MRPEEENKRTNVMGITGAYKIYCYDAGLLKRKEPVEGCGWKQDLCITQAVCT